MSTLTQDISTTGHPLVLPFRRGTAALAVSLALGFGNSSVFAQNANTNNTGTPPAAVAAASVGSDAPEQLIVRMANTRLPADAQDASDEQAPSLNALERARRRALAVDLWAGQERKRMQSILDGHTGRMQHQRVTGDGSHVIRFTPAMSAAERLQAIEQLKRDGRVEWVEIDRRTQTQAANPVTGVTNLLNGSARSWFLKAVATEPASTNTANLWTKYRGDSRSIVAVVDTGVLPDHPSLRGHVLPGYDMVADAFTANDGQAASSASNRDNDPSDPGNGVSAADALGNSGCSGPANSTWHGTFVAALIAGNPMQAEQVFPINWHGQILPVRALGRCGGFTSDLADAVRWAAGAPVPGAPINPSPAGVINLSLGATGPCAGNVEGAAVNEAISRGSIVVAAAGNRGAAVDSPANCSGVISVGALDEQGGKADYSNHGTAVTLMAPGGDFAYPMWSASNSGVQGPINNTYSSKIGTSFAAPLVASTISLMRSLNPSLTQADILRMLQQTARPFLSVAGNPACSPSVVAAACNCNRSECGAGMLDTAAAVTAARPNSVLANLSGPAVVTPGGSGRYDASESFNPAGGALNWQWKVVAFSGNQAPVIASPTASVTDIAFPQGTQAAEIELIVSNGSQSHSIFKTITAGTVGAAQVDTIGALGTLLTGGASSTAGAGTGSAFDNGGASSGTANGSQSGNAQPASSGGGGGGQWPLSSLLLLAAGLVTLRRANR